mmetsp:Transcript_34232/g.75431  ORF Transcript_34232/g.75431 Transcript_34232/m.75431 type:complete len:449 (-) Transcript_34232:160-1506(-)
MMEKEHRLMLAIVLSLTFMVIEVIGGHMANSIAIYSDAAHLLTDIAGFAIALIATIAAKSPGTKTLTFGMARAEVFGALGSILSLWIITAYLLTAASLRALAWAQGRAEDVNGGLMFIVACFGVLVNCCLGMVFSEDHGGDFHPAHSHDHGHAAHDDDHGHSGHSGHGKEKETEHKETTPLLGGTWAKTKAGPACSGHDHNSHGHNTGQITQNTGHDHSHGHGHEEDHHEHSEHGHGGHEGHETPSYQSTNPTSPAKAGGCGHGHSAHESSDVNIEAAYLHVLTDLIQSVGVAIAGAVLWWKPHWQIIDPVCTFLFSIVALRSTLPLINRVCMILFEGTPSTVNWETVKSRFQAIDEVEDVHDLHIWSISSKSISLTCHMRARNPQVTLKKAHLICRELGIDHSTIQVHDCTDGTFCYSETCDGHEEGNTDDGAPCAAGSKGKPKASA